jgi:hypothetical protein
MAMKTLRHAIAVFGLAGVLLADVAAAIQVPAGTQLSVRLKTKVASNLSKPKDPVEAVLIAPVLVGEQIGIPDGSTLRGEVVEAKPVTKPEDRAVLSIQFTQLQDPSGTKAKISSRMVQVDNARESLDTTGRIQGILGSETLSARMDKGLEKLGNRSKGLADILQLAKGALVGEADPEIVYEPGVEMTVELTKPLNWEPGDRRGPALDPIPDQDALAQLVNRQPFQTTAANPPHPSDLTNLMFIGTAEQVEQAFQAAGWSRAAQLNSQSGMETLRAIADMRGYKEAPMSLLLLEGQKPDFDFQKGNNTFAMRHHLRIWKRPDEYQGKPVWVCAATHDIGIAFSEENRTFIHKIDSQIDRERAKVVSDLMFTGLVRSLALVERPAVPKQSMNATGDKLLTDGRMAVLIF